MNAQETIFTNCSLKAKVSSFKLSSHSLAPWMQAPVFSDISVLELSYLVKTVLTTGFKAVWATLILKSTQREKAKIQLSGRICEGPVTI